MLSCVIIAGSAWLYTANDIETPTLFNLDHISFIQQENNNVVFGLNNQKLLLENFTVPRVVTILSECNGYVFLENDEADSE